MRWWKVQTFGFRLTWPGINVTDWKGATQNVDSVDGVAEVYLRDRKAEDCVPATVVVGVCEEVLRIELLSNAYLLLQGWN